MDVLAHYLEIEWQSENTTRKVTVSTHPIDVEKGRDGMLHVEVSIFRDFEPWLGLHLSGSLVDFVPVSIGARNERTPWLKVLDDQGRAWWIPATGWSRKAGRHLAEMYRSFGTFEVEIGPRHRLIVDAVALELDRAHAQDYLDDFRDDLVWLAVGQPTGATARAGSDYSYALVKALADFSRSARLVLDRPARDVREKSEVVPITRLRPSPETFMAVIRRPGGRAYPGRVAFESPDVPDNRYIHGMVEHCLRLAHSIVRASDRHNDHLATRAQRERARAKRLQDLDVVDVSQEIFDNQISEITRVMGMIEEWTDCPDPSIGRHREFRFQPGKEYDGATPEMFYQNPDRDRQADFQNGIDFRVIRLPETLHELVMTAHRIDRNMILTLTGDATVSSFRTSRGKVGRRVVLDSISRVQVHSPVLQERRRWRSVHEGNGWRRRLSAKERKEIELEVRMARARADQMEERAKLSEAVHGSLSVIERDLVTQASGWKKAGVGSTSVAPMGMRFTQNPIYASALAAFRRVVDVERHTGIGGDALDRLGSINMLHASAIYERWCLIKIVDVLMEDYSFVPQAEWIEHVVASACRVGPQSDKGFSISLAREYPAMRANLEIEPLLGNGTRPDFRLRFETLEQNGETAALLSEKKRDVRGGLVMDAKFRTRWKRNELAEMLTRLVETKKYGEDGCRVFILQPAKAAVEHNTSPLGWGRDCDYGHRAPMRHAHGSIQLAAEPIRGGEALMNLRRLIAMQLQDVFPEPQARTARQARGDVEICTATSSFCISCGKAHAVEDVEPGKTEGHNRKWLYKCSGCGAATMETHCYDCRTTIYKNGIQMTYHQTAADQVSNVICQRCGSGF